MNDSLLQQKTASHPAASMARIAQPHGYRFDCDNVHLHARFSVLNPAANQRQWALQLWACPKAPTSAKDLAGHVIAEVALPPMSEVADETEHVDMTAFACPPAGSAEHFMALVLASGSPGKFNEIHDVAAYAQTQSFAQPRLRGNVSYRIQGDRVHVVAEHIENPRNNMNRSGTLSVELWALPTPYRGGAFNGQHTAGVVIGTLAGQTESSLTAFDLPYTAPGAGQWHMALMLREWTAAGYVTRDFTNFAEVINNRLAIAAPAPAPAPAPARQPAAAVVETKPAAVEAKPAPAKRAVRAESNSSVVVKALTSMLGKKPSTTPKAASGKKPSKPASRRP